MKLTKTDALNIAIHAGKKYDLDPYLLLGMIEQESAYETESVRLENGFFRKYAQPLVLATTTKVLLSTSFGLLQVMGYSLREMGLFQDDPTPAGIAMRVDRYMIDPLEQIMTGANWLRVKMGENPDVVRGLTRYNGSSEYPPQVLARVDRLRGEHGKGEF